MKKIFGFLVFSFCFLSCSFSHEYEVAISNKCSFPVEIHTSEHIGKRILNPGDVVFDYSEDDYFILTTDIRYFGTYETEINGCKSWSDIQRMYFYNSDFKDKQLEIVEDGFWLDNQFIEPMDWN